MTEKRLFFCLSITMDIDLIYRGIKTWDILALIHGVKK